MEIRDGTGGHVMNFRDLPGDHGGLDRGERRFPPPGAGHHAPGYGFTRTQIILQGHRFTQGYGNVTLNYYRGLWAAQGRLVRIPGLPPPAGWEYSLGPLRSGTGVHRTGLMALYGAPAHGQSGKSLEGGSVTYSDQDLPPDVKTVLDRYRRVALV